MGNIARQVATFPVWAKIVLASIALVILGLSVLLSPLVVILAFLVLIVAILALIIQLLRRASPRRWAIIAAMSFIVLLLFTGISNALYFGGGQSEQGSSPAPEERTENPEPEPEPTEQATQTTEQTEQEENQARTEPTPNPVADEDESADEPRPTVQITRVVDGDTIKISSAVDGKDTVRLIGIDAPESKEPGCGPQPLAEDAAYHASLWEGLEVELEFDEDRTDQYDRLLAYVHNDLIMNTMMNVDMVERGYAQVYIVQPNNKYEDELREAQEQAKENSLPGFDIWGLDPNAEAQLADHGNGIGEGDGACLPERARTPAPDPNENYDVPDYRDPDPNVPEPAPPADVYCEPPAYPVPPGDERDGDGDGCAGEE